MDVRMPDGRLIKNVPEGTSKAELMYKLKQSELTPEYKPDMSAGDAFLVGAGESLTGLGRGVKNIYATITGNEEMQGDISSQDKESARLMAPIRSAYPAATLAGNMAPGLATMPLSGGLLAQAVIGSVLGAADYNENQGLQGLIGGALSGVGYGIGKGISRMAGSAKAVKAPILGERGRLASRADDIGYTILPGQRHDSMPLKQLEASIKSSPFSSSLVEEGIDKNQKILNRLATKSIGDAGDEIAPHTLGDAAKRIGKVYDDVARSTERVVFDEDTLIRFYDDVAYDNIDQVNHYIKRFPGLDDGQMSGKDAADLRQVLQKAIRGATMTKPSAVDDLVDLQKIIMRSIEDANPGSKDMLRQAGTQWRNLKALERGKSVTKGNVNPRSLDTALRKADKGGYLRGRDTSDYYDAVRMSQMFGDVVGDSGTATRQHIAALMQDPTIAMTGVAMRPVIRKYLQSGGGAAAGLLGAFPGTTRAGSTGAGAFRAGLMGQ